MRRLLLLLGLLGGCDFPEYPEPSNPYDPEFSGVRQIAAPDSIWLAASTPASVTLAWTDPSSFEAGFRVVRVSPDYRPVETVAVTGPDVTTYTVPMVTGGARASFRVLAIGDGEAEGPPSAPLHVAYDGGLQLTSVYDGGAGPVSALSPDGRVLYGSYGTGGPVQAYALAPGDTVATGAIEGATSVVGFLRSGAALLAEDGPWPTDGALRYTVARGATVLSRGTLDDPEAGALRTARWKGGAVSADGRTLVGLVHSPPAESALVAWDLETGGVIQRRLGGRGALRVLAVTDGGLALIWDLTGEGDGSPALLQAVRVADNAVVWERSLPGARPVAIPAFDPEGETLLVREGGAFAILDARSGAVIGRTPGDTVSEADEQPAFLTADRFGIAVPGGLRLFDVPTLSEVQRVAISADVSTLDPSRPSVRVAGGDAVSFDWRYAIVARLSLEGEWVVVPR